MSVPHVSGVAALYLEANPVSKEAKCLFLRCLMHTNSQQITAAWQYFRLHKTMNLFMFSIMMRLCTEWAMFIQHNGHLVT